MNKAETIVAFLARCMAEDFQTAKERLKRAKELGLDFLGDIAEEVQQKINLENTDNRDDIKGDPALEGYEVDDQSDRWGTRKFRVYYSGMDDDTWRKIKNYIVGFGNNFYDISEGSGMYFYITASCNSVKPCPAGEYKLFEEQVDKLMADLKDLFPTIERRGPIFVRRWDS